ncbi:MAG: hypothetical protein H0X34_08655 [Chthoniobacterales bacterium]|nr:hypothetical protein [Chthoniobacterales bacterium]
MNTTPTLRWQASSAQPSKFPQARPMQNDSSLGDWRPGARRQQKQLAAFTRAQKEKLLHLRTVLMNSISEVARDSRADTGSHSAIGTHNGDAGSDA